MAKHKKDKREKRDKSDRKDKKRRREQSDSSDDSDGERARRRIEKEADRLTKALKKGTAEAVATDQGELQLNGRFVWKKKLERELQGGAKTKDLYARERANTDADRKVRTVKRRRKSETDKLARKHPEERTKSQEGAFKQESLLQAEIEKVQRRREEREQDRLQREREQEELARDRAAADAVELEKKEDEFHLENAKARARHRLIDGRAKPIDYLVRDLMLGSEFEVGKDEPYRVFEGLTLAEANELQDDLLEYQELDSEDPEHAAWWEALLDVCRDELRGVTRQDEADRAKLKGARPPEARRQREVGVHSAVDAETQELLAGQSYGELVKMEADLQLQLETGTAPDPEFYSAILRRLFLHKAKARLRDIQASLRARSKASGEQKLDLPAAMGWRDEYLYRDPPSPEAMDGVRPDTPEPAAPLPSIEDNRDTRVETGRAGQWSPEPLEPEDYAGEEIIDEEDDLRQQQELRMEVQRRAAANFGAGPRSADDSATAKLPIQNGGSMGAAEPSAAENDPATRRLAALAAKSMGDINEARDAPFGGEVQLESRVYWWHDKHRPRKPKYFNRVHTGYEWNKYNQTHYDHDNPPPKVVQGYKFNIFYPDLISKKTSPEYSIEADPEADEFGSTCILRFNAGPPYEDLTFRILNKEWEYSHKKGYKCVFDRDTLYLYFNFKRQRYRR